VKIRPPRRHRHFALTLLTLTSNERRLFEDGRFFHPDGGQSSCLKTPQCTGLTDTEYPLLLLTGRGTSAQWHTQTRTGRAPSSASFIQKKIYAEINSAMPHVSGVRPQQMVEVRSRRGNYRPRLHHRHRSAPAHFHSHALPRKQTD